MSSVERTVDSIQNNDDPIWVKEIHVINFKSFQDFKISFDKDVNVLVGVNNSGKSSLLRAIIACFHFIREIGQRDGELKKDSSRTAINLQYLNVPDYRDVWYNKKIRTSDHDLTQVIFKITLSNDLFFQFNLQQSFGQPHLKLVDCTRTVSGVELTKILTSMPHLIQGFVGVLLLEEYKTIFGVSKAILYGRHSEVLRNELLYFSNTEKENFKKLSRLIKKHFNVELQNVTIDQQLQEYVPAEFDNGNVVLDIGEAGSGFLQILQMLTFIFATHSKIILLDEPDAHLHPSLQRVLMNLLVELSKQEKIQFVVATHSKEIISQTDPTKIFQISNENNEAKRLTSYPEMVKVLNELGSVDNIDLAILMKTKRCLFVEGIDDMRFLTNFADKLDKKIFQGQNQVVCIPTQGSDNESYIHDLTVFKKFISDDIKGYSILDRDFKNSELITKIETESIKKGLKTHVWKQHEIENYLLVPSLIERISNNILQQKDDQRKVENIKEMIFECADELKDNVI
ncbi:MAG: AAA family ATPase, partial [Nitrosarchaeum sp.]|nr:AAA family ATPase [Nitrosarchaeum sp.]